MLQPIHTLLLVLLITPFALSRQIIIKNSCPSTIWPAYAGLGCTVTGSPGGQAGWKLEQGGSTTLNVPSDWDMARIWTRSGGTGCSDDVGSCKIGLCKGGLTCDGAEFGSLGASLAEFHFSSTNQDFYDISIVEGFTVPMTVTPSDSSCTVSSCGVETDILTQCDPRLVWPKGSGEIWGCASACTAGIQYTALDAGEFDYKNSPSCCTGEWYDRAKCPSSNAPSLLAFYDTYKEYCKMAYVFADDDTGSSSTAVFACPSKPSYVVEFCPGGQGSGMTSPPSLSQAVIKDAGGEVNVASNGDTSGGGGGGVGGVSSGITPPPNSSKAQSPNSGQTTSTRRTITNTIIVQASSTTKPAAVIVQASSTTEPAAAITTSLPAPPSTSSQDQDDQPGRHRSYSHHGADGLGAFVQAGAVQVSRGMGGQYIATKTELSLVLVEETRVVQGHRRRRSRAQGSGM